MSTSTSCTCIYGYIRLYLLLSSDRPPQLAPYVVVPSSSHNVEDEDFLLALELSKAQAREEEERRERQRREDEELEQVLKLSLIDK